MLRIALWLVLEQSLSPLPYTSVGADVDNVTVWGKQRNANRSDSMV